MKKSELIKIIKEELENVVKEQNIHPANVMIKWMSPDPARNSAILQQRVMNTGLDALIGLKAWMESPEGIKFLVQDDAGVRAIKRAIDGAIEFKQKQPQKGAQ